MAARPILPSLNPRGLGYPPFPDNNGQRQRQGDNGAEFKRLRAKIQKSPDFEELGNRCMNSILDPSAGFDLLDKLCQACNKIIKLHKTGSYVQSTKSAEVKTDKLRKAIENVLLLFLSKTENGQHVWTPGVHAFVRMMEEADCDEHVWLPAKVNDTKDARNRWQRKTFTFGGKVTRQPLELVLMLKRGILPVDLHRNFQCVGGCQAAEPPEWRKKQIQCLNPKHWEPTQLEEQRQQQQQQQIGRTRHQQLALEKMAAPGALDLVGSGQPSVVFVARAFCHFKEHTIAHRIFLQLYYGDIEQITCKKLFTAYHIFKDMFAVVPDSPFKPQLMHDICLLFCIHERAAGNLNRMKRQEREVQELDGMIVPNVDAADIIRRYVNEADQKLKSILSFFMRAMRALQPTVVGQVGDMDLDFSLDVCNWIDLNVFEVVAVFLLLALSMILEHPNIIQDRLTWYKLKKMDYIINVELRQILQGKLNEEQGEIRYKQLHEYMGTMTQRGRKQLGLINVARKWGFTDPWMLEEMSVKLGVLSFLALREQVPQMVDLWRVALTTLIDGE